MAAQLHVVFFPFMAQGHLIPTLEMVKLFSSRGLKTTIVTTKFYAPAVTKSIEKTKHTGNQINIIIIKFPSAEVGLPEGSESLDKLKSPDMFMKFFKALSLLQEPFEQILQELSPDCIVSDMFFPWTTASAAKFDIPRFVFHGLSLFALCVSENMRFYKPFKNLGSESLDSEPVMLPDFPNQIEFSKVQVPEFEVGESKNEIMELLNQVKESEVKSYGIIINSFNELEKDYVDYYRNVWGRRAWLLGPLSLSNRDDEVKDQTDEHGSLKWLDSKKPDSVIYVCFGSVAPLSSSQLHEIALGLESSGQQFIWVVKEREDGEKWLPEGFEERIKDKGLIIRGWAPQVSILEHESTGGFVTHCGWNSVLEAVSAGVVMATLPTFAEQPFNEKLLTKVLKIGIPIGSPLSNRGKSGVKKEEIAEAMKGIMEGEEALEMRIRAKSLKEMAWKAVEEGGSSYNDLTSLIDGVKAYRSQSNKI
uniref:Glucosyltransferase 4 n=1 Tax=Nemophila menziesii TaxID=79376 RepID=A0A3B1F025_NEMME|nr:glucosyltransferase 4 [Nemophila menziesii]